jgi:hypothetical protein
MKVQDYRETFYWYTGKASDITRQLSFAAIAIIWIFKKDGGTALTVPRELLMPGLLIVLALSFDLLQYCLGTVIWFLFYRIKEWQGIGDDVDIDRHNVWLEVPINVAFWIKVLCLGAAYILILKFLLRTLSFA